MNDQPKIQYSGRKTIGFFALQIRVPQIYLFQSQIHERFGERPSERLLQIHVFNYMKTLKLIPGKSHVIYFYKATKVWLGLVCLLSCACVCVDGDLDEGDDCDDGDANEDDGNDDGNDEKDVATTTPKKLK